jgi:TonB family protein
MKPERVSGCGSRTRAFHTRRGYIVTLTLILLVLIIGAGAVTPSLDLWAQQEMTRKTKKEVPPQFPLLARQLSLSGTVRVAVVISPEGKVKSAHAVGGPPLFMAPAEEAAKQWEFEPNSKESTQVLEFQFVKPK